MAGTPASRQNEISKLKDEITAEVNRDAPAIAQGVFGDNAQHPDMARVPNQQLDEIYRQKYLANDRPWLQSEAKRDPQQFLDVAKRIGVQLPSAAPPQAPQAAPAMPAPAMPPPPVAPPQLPPATPPPAIVVPPAAPAPMIAPPPPPMGPPPVILGPNGQPLPPMGA
jgi:hypothetical protein